MTKLLQFLSFMILLSITACEKEDAPKHPYNKLEGVWESVGYGYVYEIKDNDATLYNASESYAVVQEKNIKVTDLQIRFLNDDAFVLTSPEVITEITFRRLPALPDVCKNGGTLPTKEALVNFDIFWETFKEHYAFFDLREVNWDQLREVYRPQVTESNLFEILAAMIMPLNDSHVALQASGDSLVNSGTNIMIAKFEEEGGYESAYEFYVSEKEKFDQIIRRKYLGNNGQSTSNNLITWGKIGQQIGYLKIDGMVGFTEAPGAQANVAALKDALDQAMNELRNTAGMIVDVRFNSGGYDLVSLEIAGRFSDKVSLGWTKQAQGKNSTGDRQNVYVKPTGNYQFTKPVILLASNFTASAAETFTMAMDAMPHVTIVGDNTHGTFSDVLEKTLPNGWRFGLSNEITRTADGRILEKHGIAPDVPSTFFPKHDREAGIDSGIDKALTFLL